ncbi:uncharacterized protein LOC113505274 [Trichoplusia ni]|uniref:Uncharacterized protein LOC113505274 n=1 Tax=Trichoplusia ni TaxID=7111 RepID=A0A7E5WSY1_TRINI|nr:uncharacterized protein LOC113505274 [Trichoplusia ni]
MPGVKCGGCARFASALDGAKCGKCNLFYCRICAGIPPNTRASSKWRCLECKKNVARDNRNETPVRGTAQSPPSDVAGIMTIAGSPDATTSSVASPTPSEVSIAYATINKQPPAPCMDLQVILVELRAVRAEIQVFRKEMEVEMAELKTTLNSCSTRIDGLETRVDALEKLATSSPSNSNVDGIVEDLMRELNDRDQDLLANDIEVSNLPEGKAENPAHIFKVIGHKLGISLDDRDIVSAERDAQCLSYKHINYAWPQLSLYYILCDGGRQLNVTNSAGPAESRPRPIVVPLARRDLRDQLLDSARARRGATTADLDLPAPVQRFFLNERLTKPNRLLFRKARDAANALGWKFF